MNPADSMCEIVNGQPCHTDGTIDMGQGDLEHMGELIAVEYVRADGETYRHEFNPDTDLLAYAAPGVLILAGHFDVDGGGIGPDHDPANEE